MAPTTSKNLKQLQGHKKTPLNYHNGNNVEKLRLLRASTCQPFSFSMDSWMLQIQRAVCKKLTLGHMKIAIIMENQDYLELPLLLFAGTLLLILDLFMASAVAIAEAKEGEEPPVALDEPTEVADTVIRNNGLGLIRLILPQASTLPFQWLSGLQCARKKGAIAATTYWFIDRNPLHKEDYIRLSSDWISLHAGKEPLR